MYPDDDVRIYKHNYVERDRGQIGKLAWQEWTRKKKVTQQHDSWVDLLFLLPQFSFSSFSHICFICLYKQLSTETFFCVAFTQYIG